MKKSSMLKLLVVEDSRVLSEQIADLFRKAGYHVDLCDEVDEALRLIKNNFYDATLLDLSLHNSNGMDLIRKLKVHTNNYELGNNLKVDHLLEMPLVVLSGSNILEQKLEVLRANIDFINKPVHSSELFQRIENLIKRTKKTISNDFINLGELMLIDLKRKRIDYIDNEINKNKKFQLTDTEFYMLSILVEKKGVEVSRKMILLETQKRLGKYTKDFTSEKCVNVHLCHLKRKLNQIDKLKKYSFIHAIRGKGYCFKIIDNSNINLEFPIKFEKITQTSDII